MRTISLSLLVLCGCVTQSTYDALKAQGDQTAEDLAARNKSLEDANKKISSLEDKGKSLEAALADAQDKVKDLDARLNKALGDLAGLTKDKSKLQANVDQMTAALADLEKRRAQAKARVAEFKNLLTRFKSLIDAGKLKVRIVEGHAHGRGARDGHLVLVGTRRRSAKTARSPSRAPRPCGLRRCALSLPASVSDLNRASRFLNSFTRASAWARRFSRSASASVIDRRSRSFDLSLGQPGEISQRFVQARVEVLHLVLRVRRRRLERLALVFEQRDFLVRVLQATFHARRDLPPF